MGMIGKGLLLGAAGLAAYGLVRRYTTPDPARFYKGKSSIVTGGASGIGRAAVEAFAARGARVLAVDMNGDALAALAGEVPGVETLEIDVTADGASETIVSEALRRFGRLDVVFCNAGIAWSAPFVDMPEHYLDKLIAVNFISHVKLTRAVLPLFLEQGSGAIAYTGSMSAHVPAPRISLYAGTKAGLRGFVTALRRELEPGSGVRLTIIHPNFTRTNLVPQELWDDLEKTVPLQTPAQVAAALADGIALGRREVLVEVTDHVYKWLEIAAPAAVDLIFRHGFSEEFREKGEVFSREIAARSALSAKA